MTQDQIIYQIIDLVLEEAEEGTDWLSINYDKLVPRIKELLTNEEQKAL